jgi:hypothetical protein
LYGSLSGINTGINTDAYVYVDVYFDELCKQLGDAYAVLLGQSLKLVMKLCRDNYVSVAYLSQAFSPSRFSILFFRFLKGSKKFLVEATESTRTATIFFGR